MASIDGGYYFLTVLAPVRREWPDDEEGKGQYRTAPIIELRKKLAQMPTAMQTPRSQQSGEISAFSKSTRTHLARFAVIDRLGYNGYEAADPVLDKAGLAKPMTIRSELARPYLLFAAEFDAPSGSKNYDLAVYLRELWEVMHEDLVEIFQNCVAFEADEITTAADFIAYIKRCEIETTMPFNFYWTQTPELPSLNAWSLGLGAVLTGLGMAAVFAFLFSSFFWVFPVLAGIIAFFAGLIGFVAIRFKMVGDKPFPAPPDGDLISVLKGLHVQTSFGRFVADNQAADDAELHRAFGDYLKENQPSKPTPRHPAGRVYQ